MQAIKRINLNPVFLSGFGGEVRTIFAASDLHEDVVRDVVSWLFTHESPSTWGASDDHVDWYDSHERLISSFIFLENRLEVKMAFGHSMVTVRSYWLPNAHGVLKALVNHIPKLFSRYDETKS